MLKLFSLTNKGLKKERMHKRFVKALMQLRNIQFFSATKWVHCFQVLIILEHAIYGEEISSGKAILENH